MFTATPKDSNCSSFHAQVCSSKHKKRNGTVVIEVTEADLKGVERVECFLLITRWYGSEGSENQKKKAE